MQHHHRPTLKQHNKSFKSKHATKSTVKNIAKGRVARSSSKSAPSSNTAAQSRGNRRNAAKQTQLRKRQALIASTRIFNGVNGAPRIVAVVPLCSDVLSKDAVVALAQSLDADLGDCPNDGLWHMKAERFKTSLQFVLLPYRNLYAALDACKVADYVVFVLSGRREVDAWGDLALRCLQAQGLPEVVAVLTASHSEEEIQPHDPKARSAVLKSLLSFIRYFVPAQSRVYDLENTGSDATNAMRALCEGKPNIVHWREGRSWVLGENVEWEEGGTLKVTGVVRGNGMSVNRLVHIPNYGDFQLSEIVSAPRSNSPRKGVAATMDLEPTTLAVPTTDADSLVSLNDPDIMANEQTWPTDEEMRGADVEMDSLVDNQDIIPDANLGTTPKVVKKVPKGTSQYQAAWIVEEEGDDSDADDRSDGEEEEDMQEIEMDAPSVHPEEDVDLESDHKSTAAFKDLEADEEDRQFETWRTRIREAEMDLAFPDEIDTPKEVPARQRFQRFRGMRSFRTSPWDPYENLPKDYAKIFQFEDYRRTERAVRRRAEEEGATNVDAGSRVTIHIKDVPKLVIDSFDSRNPFIVFALLQHEHKISVLNFTVQRNTEYSAPVKSKDPLILCVGPRRLRTNPVFSQHTRGGGKGANNVHKFERFLPFGGTSVATTYGPVVFGKQPCMLLRETDDAQAPSLIAMGTFLNADTTRVISKRVVLTGHPFKVHKKTATVRYMFFNSEDVAYFAPVQLHTKHGRAGHIRESLGTHGYFKAHFDGPVSQMDTVCMSLYKRVYPRWSSLWPGVPHKTEGASIMEE